MSPTDLDTDIDSEDFPLPVRDPVTPVPIILMYSTFWSYAPSKREKNKVQSVGQYTKTDLYRIQVARWKVTTNKYGKKVPKKVDINK